MGNKSVKCYYCKKEIKPGEERSVCEKCGKQYHPHCLGMHETFIKKEVECLYCKKKDCIIKRYI